MSGKLAITFAALAVVAWIIWQASYDTRSKRYPSLYPVRRASIAGGLAAFLFGIAALVFGLIWVWA